MSLWRAGLPSPGCCGTLLLYSQCPLCRRSCRDFPRPFPPDFPAAPQHSRACTAACTHSTPDHCSERPGPGPAVLQCCSAGCRLQTAELWPVSLADGSAVAATAGRAFLARTGKHCSETVIHHNTSAATPCRSSFYHLAGR